MDAYRSPANPTDAPIAVIGRRNALSHAYSLVVHAALIAGVVWVIVAWQWPTLLGLIGIILGISLLQDLYALSIRVEFVLTDTGMHLRHGQRALGPWMRRIDRFIPWAEVRGIRVHEVTINGIASATLYIDTVAGEVAVEPGTFDTPADRLQTLILDRMHALGGAAERDAARVDEFCRTRWATPLRLVARPRHGQSIELIVLLAVPLAAMAYFMPWLWPLWLAVACMYLALSAASIAAWRRVRVLELRAEGLAHGDSPERLTVLPWQDILLARRRVDTSRLRRETTAIELRLRGERTLVLNADYGRPLDDLAELIDPPPAKLALARAGMAAGAELEAATRAAGLPARTMP